MLMRSRLIVIGVALFVAVAGGAASVLWAGVYVRGAYCYLTHRSEIGIAEGVLRALAMGEDENGSGVAWSWGPDLTAAEARAVARQKFREGGGEDLGLWPIGVFPVVERRRPAVAVQFSVPPNSFGDAVTVVMTSGEHRQILRIYFSSQWMLRTHWPPY